MVERISFRNQMDSRKEISLINNSKAFKLLSNITLT